MSRKGSCRDNAVAESFFSRLKKARIRKRIYQSSDVAFADVASCIEAFYLCSRRHSHLGDISHEKFGAVHATRPRTLH